MNITYDYYKIFYYVAKYGSFTKAAQMLNSSQPNITRAKNNLESQLGIKLIIRTNQGVTLTEEGEQFFEKLSVAIEQIKLAENHIVALKNNEGGNCKIGVSDIGLYEVLLSVLPKLRKSYPKILFGISNESSVSAVKNLRDRLIDFAIVTTPIPAIDDLNVTEIKSVQECAVVSDRFIEDFDFDLNKEYSIKEISEYPIIMLGVGTSTRAMYDRFFSDNGLELNPQMVTSNVDQVIYMVNSGLGIGFLPENLLRYSDLVRKVKLKEKIPPRMVCILSREGQKNNKIVDTVVGTIKNEVEQM